MKSYKFLRILSGTFYAISLITLLGGILLSTSFILRISEHDYGEYHQVMTQDYSSAFMMLFGSIVGFLILMAISQAISLMINVAEDVSSIATNAYVIAQKTAEKRIDENEL